MIVNHKFVKYVVYMKKMKEIESEKKMQNRKKACDIYTSFIVNFLNRKTSPTFYSSQFHKQN